MVIPLTHEEYFDNHVCMNCYHVMDVPIHFHFPDDNMLELCENCSFGLYQCVQCGKMVSHLQNDLYGQMVYTGPENPFDPSFIFCHECVENGQQTEEEDDTDIEQESDCCDLETSTQILC